VTLTPIPSSQIWPNHSRCWS